MLKKFSFYFVVFATLSVLLHYILGSLDPGSVFSAVVAGLAFSGVLTYTNRNK